MSQSASQSQDPRMTPDPFLKSKSYDKKKGKARKRKRSQSPEPNLVEILTHKWEKEEEERKLQRELLQQEQEARERREVEMMKYFKIAAEAITRLAEG